MSEEWDSFSPVTDRLLQTQHARDKTSFLMMTLLLHFRGLHEKKLDKTALKS